MNEIDNDDINQFINKLTKITKSGRMIRLLKLFKCIYTT